MKRVADILLKSKELSAYWRLFNKSANACLAIVTSARPMIVAASFIANKRSSLVIVAGKNNSKVFANDLRKLLNPDVVIEYTDAITNKTKIKDQFKTSASNETSNRFKALYYLSNAKPVIVVASASSILKNINQADMENLQPLKIAVNKEYNYNDIMEKLKKFGYTRLEVLDGPSTFSVKGGTINIYPAQQNYPVQIEFFGDEVEDIRQIVLSTGQTIKSLNSVELFSANESQDFEKMKMLQQIISKKTVVYMDEPRAILDDMRNFTTSLATTYKIPRSERKIMFANPQKINFNKQQCVSLVSIMQRGIKPDAKLTLKRPPKYKNLEELNMKLPGYKIISDLPINMSYLVPDVKLAMICNAKPKYLSGSNNEYFDTNTAKYIDITKITFPYKPGDYVVHSFYGIALFKDIVKREIAGSIRDYLLLEYAENDKLYVPIEQFGRVTKYVGPQGYKPKITRLGTSDWSRAMGKARKATRKMAFDLVDVYSRRALAKGHAFRPDNKAQKNMENDFPFMETDDQMRAIIEVKHDMQSDTPMDRLICGDVGFGKTEVALRAAFKCVQDKMQVMFLCPTTILAQQHYTTFSNRLKPYGVQVDVLSRFKTLKESKQIAANFQSGKLDVLIGTHRLLSRDINPKNLGLIIIDEEQRFGVGHKEQLKHFRESVDVLTLTATPIPRTMQMATSGVRDMSIINTPPSNRKAVDVYVGEWDSDIVSEAIRRELERGGQVYYISNWIKTIKDAADRVGLAVGEAKIGVVHGRMKKAQIESVMEEFSAGKFDVLVSTTIIENGIDNPNTNTLIIEDAQNLGLSQMYQLKGRVGRSVEQAYAYFMFKKTELLTKETIARLKAIDEFRELGSGIQIAMRDLEIRGAGNFLGAEQSGNVSHIGFDLFAQMLKSAVEKTQSYDGNYKCEDEDYLEPTISDVSVNIPGRAYLSSDIIPEVDKRVLWYRRFSSAHSVDEVMSIKKEFEKIHKEICKESKNFLLKSLIAAVGLKIGFSIISIIRGNLVLEGKQLTAIKIKELKQIEGKYYPQNKKISIPLDRIIDTDSDKIFGQILDFLNNWDF